MTSRNSCMNCFRSGKNQIYNSVILFFLYYTGNRSFMSKKGKRFFVKWRDKTYYVLRVTRSRECIVFASPGIPTHTNYPKDGRLHWTVEDINIQIHSQGIELKITDKPRIYIEGGRPPFSELKSPVSIETRPLGLEVKPQDKLKKHELIDMDALGCKIPNVTIFLCPPHDSEVSKIPLQLKGKREVIKFNKFNDVWVVVDFVDVLR